MIDSGANRQRYDWEPVDENTIIALLEVFWRSHQFGSHEETRCLAERLNQKDTLEFLTMILHVPNIRLFGWLMLWRNLIAP